MHRQNCQKKQHPGQNASNPANIRTTFPKILQTLSPRIARGKYAVPRTAPARMARSRLPLFQRYAYEIRDALLDLGIDPPWVYIP